MTDPILKELHETREKLLAESGGTLASLVARLQREQSESGLELRQYRLTLQGLDSAEKVKKDLRQGSE